MLARTLVVAAALALPTAALAQVAPAPQPPPAPQPTTTAPAPAPTAPGDPNAYPPYPPQPPPPQALAPTTITAGPPPDPPGQVEMTADFGAIGLLAGITIDTRGVHDSSLGTMVILGSTAGGGAVGYLLADKFQATRGDAYLTTLGLTVGMANGALLLRPLHDTDTAEQVLGVLTLSSALGATAGFAASRGEKLTPGQALFATDLTYLGVGSAALIASLEDRNGKLDNGELATLAIGLDGGALAGLLIAPRVDWSQHRARMVGVGTLAGTFLGGMVAGLAAPHTKNADGSTSTDFDPDYVATALLLGAWGGFGASIYLTRDTPPDPKLDPRYQAAGANPPVTVMPFVRGDGFGAAVSGAF
jgi:hypothetical protein